VEVKMNRSIVFETERLLVRTATVEDAELIYELWTDPRVMANVGFPQGLRTALEEIEKRLQSPFESEFERSLIVELTETGQPIGQCLMHLPNEEGIAETDIKLLPVHWGHRYGVEVKRGLLAHLFTHTDCVAVHGTPNVENAASIKMQKAVGGVRISEGVHEFPESMREYTAPVHYYVYEVSRENWEQVQRKEAR
jgi:ribosomal-protein-alanine N-acetyltransferase